MHRHVKHCKGQARGLGWVLVQSRGLIRFGHVWLILLYQLTSGYFFSDSIYSEQSLTPPFLLVCDVYRDLRHRSVSNLKSLFPHGPVSNLK
jgi:hypothetical protein